MQIACKTIRKKKTIRWKRHKQIYTGFLITSPSKGLAHFLDWATDNYEVDGESHEVIPRMLPLEVASPVARKCTASQVWEAMPTFRSRHVWTVGTQPGQSVRMFFQRTPWNTQTSEFGPRRSSKFTARFFCKQCGTFVDEMPQAEARRRRQLGRDCSSSFIWLRSSQYQRTRLRKSLVRMERLCSSAPRQRTSRLPRLLRRMSQGTTCQSGDHEASTAWGQEAAPASSAKRGW